MVNQVSSNNASKQRLCLAIFTLVLGKCIAWQVPQISNQINSRSKLLNTPSFSTMVHFSSKFVPEATTEIFQDNKATDSIEILTEKYGLEVGLFKSLKEEDGGETAKGLLKKYGIAYLATSIPLAIISFAICYVLVDSGVDVQSILTKIGLASETANSEAAGKVGTVAIAYAAHKAASPIRFPPTVILTPTVAKLIGKEPKEKSYEHSLNE